uniref:ATP synthase complex subunit 8 n=1 Tax=Scyra compressipes TaxID=1235674 RepID=A0A891S8I6_9EUCA|nr:ATP synthase F0 subunit 8 [Scyra compressipes]QRM82001.1 ATP synthase F0 subunit 8 [Scyra compressipes]
MPQMAPLLWLYLFLFFTFSLFLFLTFNFYISFFNKTLWDTTLSKDKFKIWKF